MITLETDGVENGEENGEEGTDVRVLERLTGEMTETELIELVT